MLSTSSRQRAEAYIRRALTAGHNPWSALDAYRRRGGRIRWNDWFPIWNRIAKETAGQDQRRAWATTREASRPRRSLLP
jgi:hypothetical protein